MRQSLRSKVLPESQRRTLEELTEDLDLRSGDAASKQSAFWTMLRALAGDRLYRRPQRLHGDRHRRHDHRPALDPDHGHRARPRQAAAQRLHPVRRGRRLLVILIGVLSSQLVPAASCPSATARSPRAPHPGCSTCRRDRHGFAGAVALSRRDVAAVLPGVAIAISLVPPLVVVGVCLGLGDSALALRGARPVPVEPAGDGAGGGAHLHRARLRHRGLSSDPATAQALRSCCRR